MIVFLLKCCLFYLHLHYLTAQFIQLGRHGIQFCFNQRTCLIYQINCLIRQKSVGDITIGQYSCTDQCIIHNLNTMIYLIAFLQTTQNRYRIFHRRFVYHDRLETTLQCRVFLNILTVFIQCGGTDTVQFAPRQHRLQHIAGIQRSISLTGSNNRMQLINKQDDLSVAVLHIIQYSFQTLLKFAPVLRSGNQRTHIQRKNLFILQAFRYIAPDNTLCQSFCHRSFANTGFTDQHRIILRLT